MKILKLVFVIVLSVIECVYAQSKAAFHPDTKHIVLVNSQFNRRTKEMYVGDKVRLKLITSFKVKGSIMSIDSTFFTINNVNIPYDMIRKISNKKGWLKGVGAAMIVGGLLYSFTAVFAEAYVSVATSSFGSPFEEPPYSNALPGLLVAGAGIVMVLPGYYRIGNYELVVVSTRPNVSTLTGVKN